MPATAIAIPAGVNTFTVLNFDPCGPATLTFTETTGGDLCGGTQQIVRNWTITDGSNNTSSCTQTISITPATLDAFTLPGDVTLECGQNPNDPALVGQPSGNGCANINVVAEPDIVVDVCAGSVKLLRKYIIYDWCTNTSMEHTQIIKVLDTQGPALTCPADLTLSLIHI